MTPVATIGLDIAKNVFQVHGVHTPGQVVVRRRLSRGRVLEFFEKLKPCLFGIEAWGIASPLQTPGSPTKRNAYGPALFSASRNAKTSSRVVCGGPSVGKDFLKFLHGAGWCGHVSGLFCGLSICRWP